MPADPTLDEQIAAVRRVVKQTAGVAICMRRDFPDSSATLGAEKHAAEIAAALATLEASRPTGQHAADMMREVMRGWGARRREILREASQIPDEAQPTILKEAMDTAAAWPEDAERLANVLQYLKEAPKESQPAYWSAIDMRLLAAALDAAAQERDNYKQASLDCHDALGSRPAPLPDDDPPAMVPSAEERATGIYGEALGACSPGDAIAPVLRRLIAKQIAAAYLDGWNARAEIKELTHPVTGDTVFVSTRAGRIVGAREASQPVETLTVSDEEWEHFIETMNNPAPPTPALSALLTKQSPWEAPQPGDTERPPKTLCKGCITPTACANGAHPCIHPTGVYDAVREATRLVRRENVFSEQTLIKAIVEILHSSRLELDAAQSALDESQAEVARLKWADESDAAAADDMQDRAIAAQDFIIARGLWDEFAEMQPDPDARLRSPTATGEDRLLAEKLDATDS